MRMEWELLMFFGAPLVWGAWQLWTLRRDRQRAERERQQRDGTG